MTADFLESLIDYAGLFPPSALSISDATANYARYRESPEVWMLAKFVVPIERAHEVPSAFPLSVLSSNDFDADARVLASLPNAGAIEIKVSAAVQLDAAIQSLPAKIEKYFEITDLSLIPAISAQGARAKIRTGGVTPESFPSADFIAHFLIACAKENVPFKATAGLHHPLRCYRPLTYAAGAPSGWMYGFLNVFAAGALARDATMDDLRPILLAENLAEIPQQALQKRELAISFGSCSFEEPVADLKTLGLLC